MSLTAAAIFALFSAHPVAPAEAVPEAKLPVQHVSPYIDYVAVLPGARFPLRVLDAKGRAVEARWQASAGAVAHGGDLAVWKAPLAAGAYRLTGTAQIGRRKVSRTLQMIVTVPATRIANGKLNGYPIGKYPRGFGRADVMVANRGSRDGDAVPAGFIELSSATLDTPLSTHYKVRDFAGKDAAVNGRKYLFINPRLVEKLERITEGIREAGYQTGKLELMSAYRSPWLNAAIGNKTTLSRHTYGDAADIVASDFNRDGKVDRTDANILMGVIDKLDRTSDLVGGMSLYPPNSAHGYFIHTDTRGTAARW